MKWTKYRRWPFIMGSLCLIASAAVFLSNYSEDQAAGTQAKEVLKELQASAPMTVLTPVASVEPATEPAKDDLQRVPENTITTEKVIPDYILNPDMDMPTIEIGGNLYVGALLFPALDLELPVMSDWSYPGLKISPCMYSGSIYDGNAVIAAHNYVSHFGRLSELGLGDVVCFTDMDGNIFKYEIIVQETLAPTAITEMQESHADLTLFTCTLSGTSRFTVRCKLMEAPHLFTTNVSRADRDGKTNS